MGIVASWLTGCLFPEEQALWHAASAGDHRGLRDAIAKLTPETRRYLDWQDSCSGRTPLAQAAAKGHLECVAALVEAGVNVNTKDYKGNTPLHLACRHGHADVVKLLVRLVHVVPFEVNLRLRTPLDEARDRLRRQGGKEERPRTAEYEECIAELEKKFYIYSGWLYEKTDNLLSAVSGISNLSSWKHRYCIVLQRGLPDVLELALFSVRKGDTRPALPSSVILLHVQSGVAETNDDKWFNRKSFTFAATGSVLLRDGCCEERHQAASTRTVEFAATDAESLNMWKSFFLHHQEMLSVAQGRVNPPPAPAIPAVVATPGVASAATRPRPSPVYYVPSASSLSQYPADMGRELHQRSASSSRTSVATMSVLRDEDGEEEDLRRAIELSLQDAARAHGEAGAISSPQRIQSSAPAWTEDEADTSAGESYDGSLEETAPSDAARGGDHSRNATESRVSYSRAPTFSTIGECVVCFDGPQAAVCVPCGHNAVCMACGEEILDTTCECPVCRQPIRELIKLYRV